MTPPPALVADFDDGRLPDWLVPRVASGEGVGFAPGAGEKVVLGFERLRVMGMVEGRGGAVVTPALPLVRGHCLVGEKRTRVHPGAGTVAPDPPGTTTATDPPADDSASRPPRSPKVKLQEPDPRPPPAPRGRLAVNIESKTGIADVIPLENETLLTVELTDEAGGPLRLMKVEVTVDVPFVRVRDVGKMAFDYADDSGRFQARIVGLLERLKEDHPDPRTVPLGVTLRVRATTEAGAEVALATHQVPLNLARISGTTVGARSG